MFTLTLKLEAVWDCTLTRAQSFRTKTYPAPGEDCSPSTEHFASTMDPEERWSSWEGLLQNKITFPESTDE